MNASLPLSDNPLDLQGIVAVLQQDVPPTQWISEFESRLAVLYGRPVVATHAGTSALHLALKAVGVGPGDTVVVPSFTYVATANPVRYLGAQLAFVDAEPHRWNLDPDLLHDALEQLQRQGARVRAVVVAHTYGMPADLDRLLEVTSLFGIPLVEDAAESIGSALQSRLTGTWGRIGVLSFNANKVITTFGGGAVVCRDQEEADRVRFWAAQAREPHWHYLHHEEGYNYRMNPLAAAYGISQLDFLPKRSDERRRVFEHYRVSFEPMGAQWQPDGTDRASNRWLSAFVFPGFERIEALLKALAAKGIEARPLWKPLHEQPLFDGVPHFTRGMGARLFMSGVCLPSSAQLTHEQIDRVVRVVREVVGGR